MDLITSCEDLRNERLSGWEVYVCFNRKSVMKRHVGGNQRGVPGILIPVWITQFVLNEVIGTERSEVRWSENGDWTLKKTGGGKKSKEGGWVKEKGGKGGPETCSTTEMDFIMKRFLKGKDRQGRSQKVVRSTK